MIVIWGSVDSYMGWGDSVDSYMGSGEGVGSYLGWGDSVDSYQEWGEGACWDGVVVLAACSGWCWWLYGIGGGIGWLFETD